MQLVIEKFGTKLRVSGCKFEVVGKDFMQHFSAEQVSHIFLHKKTSITSQRPLSTKTRIFHED